MMNLLFVLALASASDNVLQSSCSGGGCDWDDCVNWANGCPASGTDDMYNAVVNHDITFTTSDPNGLAEGSKMTIKDGAKLTIRAARMVIGNVVKSSCAGDYFLDANTCVPWTTCDATTTTASNTPTNTVDRTCGCKTGFNTLTSSTVTPFAFPGATLMTCTGITCNWATEYLVGSTCTLRRVCDADSTNTVGSGSNTVDDTCTCKSDYHTLTLGTTCSPHTVCDADSTNASIGSATVNVVCTCKSGYHTLTGDTTCTAHTVCDADSTTVTTTGSATVDVACACKSGYHTLTGGTTCTENQCVCTNGTGATNTACPTDGDVKCMSCGTGFNLSDEVPVLGTTCIVQCSITCEIAQPLNRIVVTHDTTSGHSRHLCYKQGCGPMDTVGCTCACTCSGDGVVFTPSHWGDHDNNDATRHTDSTGAVAENWGVHSTPTN